jgi:hypothetical protein
MRTTRLFSVIAVSTGLLIGAAAFGPAIAQNIGAQATAQSGLTIGQVHDKLAAQGFRDINDIEREGDRFEVKATNAEGKRVKLDVDAMSGDILDTRVKSDKPYRASDKVARGDSVN